jgi:hypothetical protein
MYETYELEVAAPVTSSPCAAQFQDYVSTTTTEVIDVLHR